MKRWIQWMLVLVSAMPALSQGFGLPPGKWWRMPQVAQKLELTRAQQDRLDEVFRTSAPELIDLKAELEKATVSLRGTMDRSEVDRSAVLRAADAVSEARANLFARELELLLDMRAVLEVAQWNQLRRALDERREGPPRPSRRPRPH